MAQAGTILACIPEVPGSNLGRETYHPDPEFSWLLSVTPGIEFNKDRFFPSPLFPLTATWPLHTHTRTERTAASRPTD
jgi:hypothetical protein